MRASWCAWMRRTPRSTPGLGSNRGDHAGVPVPLDGCTGRVSYSASSRRRNPVNRPPRREPGTSRHGHSRPVPFAARPTGPPSTRLPCRGASPVLRPAPTGCLDSVIVSGPAMGIIVPFSRPANRPHVAPRLRALLLVKPCKERRRDPRRASPHGARLPRGVSPGPRCSASTATSYDPPRLTRCMAHPACEQACPAIKSPIERSQDPGGECSPPRFPSCSAARRIRMSTPLPRVRPCARASRSTAVRTPNTSASCSPP